MFPTPIEPLKGVVMIALFSGKQAELKNLAESLETMAFNPEIHPRGMNYLVTRYQEIHHEQSPKQC